MVFESAECRSALRTYIWERSVSSVCLSDCWPGESARYVINIELYSENTNNTAMPFTLIDKNLIRSTCLWIHKSIEKMGVQHYVGKQPPHE